MGVICLLRAPNIMRMIVVSPSFNIPMLLRCLEKDCTNAFNSSMANDYFLKSRRQFKKNGNGNNK